jgi:hypothetical protein
MSTEDILVELSRSMGRVEGKIDDLAKQNIRQQQIDRLFHRRLLVLEEDVKRLSWISVPIRWVLGWFKKKAGITA